MKHGFKVLFMLLALAVFSACGSTSTNESEEDTEQIVEDLEQGTEDVSEAVEENVEEIQGNSEELPTEEDPQN